MMRNYDSAKTLGIITVIILALTLIFGPGLISRCAEWQAPHFTIRAKNVLAGNNTYEITNNLIWGSNSDPITVNWEIEVIPDYQGNTSYGEIRVLIKNEKGYELARDSWPDFKKGAQTLHIKLDPYKLVSDVQTLELYGGFEKNIFETGEFPVHEAKFHVEIMMASDLNTPMQKEILTLRNSPWYHYTAMSGWHDDSIDVFVHGKNLGDKSDFLILSELFEIVKIPGQPWVDWPRIDFNQLKVSGILTGQTFDRSLSFPKNKPDVKFEKGKLYLIRTYLIKRQEYAKFPDGDWENSAQNWRLGSFFTEHFFGP